MTIQMLATWNGMEEDGVFTLAGAEETRLIGLGLARAFTAGRMDGSGVNALMGTTDPTTGAVTVLSVDGSGNNVATEIPKGLGSLVSGAGKSFVGMGHSRIAQSFNGQSFPFLSYGYPTIITQMLGQRISWLGNFAVGSVGISHVITTQLPQLKALATKPEYVLMEIGYNDFANGLSAEVVQAQYMTIAQELFSMGIRLVAVTDSPGSTLSANKQLQQQLFNDWLLRQSTRQWITVDGYSCVVGSAADNSAGAMHSTMVQTDGVHHAPSGAMAIARELFTVLDPLIPRTRAFGGGVAPFAQVIPNPNAEGNNASGSNGWSVGAGITGNGPSNWNAARSGTSTATTSIVARSASAYAPQNKTGGLLQVAATIAATNEVVLVEPMNANRVRFTPFSTGATVALGDRIFPTVDNGLGYVVTTAGTLGAADDSASWSEVIGAVVQSGAGTARLTVVPKIGIGDTVVFVAEVFGAVTAGAAGVFAEMSAYTAAFGLLATVYGGRLNTTTYGPNASYMPPSLVLQTLPLVIPATTNFLTTRINICGTAGATATVQIGTCELRKIG